MSQQTKPSDMKCLGLIGGTSWHSTIEYYRLINEAVNGYFGDNTNPPLVIANLNQSEVHRLQVADQWSGISDMLTDAANRLRAAGAEAVMFCANTPHKCFDDVQSQIELPVLHIGDATAKAINRQSLDCVGLIGTQFSMSETFITDRYRQHGIETIVPEQASVIVELHRIIQQELTYGKIVPSSRSYVMDTISAMRSRGAQGIVLGCTEFPLMLGPGDLEIPVFDTTSIHAQCATEFVLGLE